MCLALQVRVPANVRARERLQRIRPRRRQLVDCANDLRELAGRVVVADDDVARLLVRRDEPELVLQGVEGVLGVEEREVDPRNPDLLECDRDVSPKKHHVVLHEIGPGLEQLESGLRPLGVRDAVPEDGPLGMEHVDGHDRPCAFRVSQCFRHADRAEATRRVPIFEDRQWPIRAMPCEVARERGVEQETVAPVELLVLRYDLRRERELVDECGLGKRSEALAQRGEECLVAMLACPFRERREPLSGDARGIHTEGVLVVGAVPATPHVETRSAKEAPEERLDHAGQRYRGTRDSPQ